MDNENANEYLVDKFVYPKKKNTFSLINEENCNKFNIKFSNLDNKIKNYQIFNKTFKNPSFNLGEIGDTYLDYFYIDSKKLIPKKNLIIIINILSLMDLKLKLMGDKKFI